MKNWKQIKEMCRRGLAFFVSMVVIIGIVNTCGGQGFTALAEALSVAEDFEDGTWEYLEEPQEGNENGLTILSPEFGAAKGDMAIKFDWLKEYHDQTLRATRSSELVTGRVNWEEDVWESFYYYFPSEGFQKDSLGTVIKQWIAWNTEVPDCNKTFDLEVVNDTLYAHVLWNDEENSDKAHPHDQSYIVSPELPKDEWIKFEMHYRFDLDSPDGFVEIWMNGEPMLQLKDIQIGVGINSYGPYSKYGPYVYNSSTYDERYFYADDINWSTEALFDHTGDVFPDKTMDEDAWYGKVEFEEAVYDLGDASTGQDVIEFDVTPFLNYLDGCIGYMDSSTLATSYSSMNMIIRLNSSGYFDARNGSSYEAVNELPYEHDKTYHVTIESDIATSTYDVVVTSEDGSQTVIAENYAYRTGAPSIDDIGKVMIIDSVADDEFKVKNHRVNGQEAPEQVDEEEEQSGTVVVPVKDNRDGILTMIMDDGYKESAEFYVSEFEKYDLKGSLALITNWVDNDPEFWKNIVASGVFDVHSHSVSHIDLSDTSLDMTTIQHEVIDSQTMLRNTFEGQDVLGFIAPENKSNGASDEVIVDTYQAMRKGYRGYNSLSPSEPDWYNLMVQGVMSTASESTMQNWVDTAVEDGKWLIEMWHAVAEYNPSTYNPLTEEKADNHLSYIAQQQEAGNLWVATFGEAIQYIRERQNAHITVDITDEVITIDYTDELDDELFDYPVTLKSEVPESWEGAIIRQNDRTTQKDVHREEDGKAYVYYDAIPDNGLITIVEGDSTGDNGSGDDRVFIENDFEDESSLFDGLEPHIKSNHIEIAQEDNYNHYMSMSMANPVMEDSHLDAKLSEVTSDLIVSMDISTSDVMPGGNLQYKDISGATKYLLYFGDNRIKTTDYKTIATVTENQWIHIDLAMDFEASTMKVYADGVPVHEVPLAEDSATMTLSMLRIYMNNDSDNAGKAFHMDNFMVYEGKIPLNAIIPIQASFNTPDTTVVLDDDDKKITAYIDLEGGGNVNTVEFWLEYDKSMLELEGIHNADNQNGVFLADETDEGSHIMGYYINPLSHDEQQLLKLVFDIKQMSEANLETDIMIENMVMSKSSQPALVHVPLLTSKITVEVIHVLGDVNMDGVANLVDLSIAVNNNGITDEDDNWQQLKFADQNGDHRIDPTDFILIMEAIMEN